MKDDNEDHKEGTRKACQLIWETLTLNQVYCYHAVNAFFTIMMRMFIEEGVSYEEFYRLMNKELKSMKSMWKDNADV